MRLTTSLVLAISASPLACAGADDPAGTGPASSDASSGDVDPTTSSEGSLTTTEPTMTASSPSTTTPAEESSSEGESSSSTADDDSSSSGASCAVGTPGCPCDVGSCASDLVCVDDVCEASEICAVDGYEPNDSEAEAYDLGILGDGDDALSIVGTLDHADDEDWFTYAGEDNLGIGPGVAPGRELGANGGLRLCKFLECPSGIENTEVTCPAGSDLAQSSAGRPGCCSDASIAMPDFNCSGGVDDSAQVYIRLDNAEAQCVDWSVSYEY
ncbi:MAG: hypothetical protein IAG13_37815 [Deltaproteobacteria bacterium]|nr:hypothetical protein [Nannocystaceae bacterium]